MHDLDLFQQALGLEEPWEVVDVGELVGVDVWRAVGDVVQQHAQAIGDQKVKLARARWGVTVAAETTRARAGRLDAWA